jgi:septal ring factor EnvC (AmiA/AmiB activator)
MLVLPRKMPGLVMKTKITAINAIRVLTCLTVVIAIVQIIFAHYINAMYDFIIVLFECMIIELLRQIDYHREQYKKTMQKLREKEDILYDTRAELGELKMQHRFLTVDSERTRIQLIDARADLKKLGKQNKELLQRLKAWNSK